MTNYPFNTVYKSLVYRDPLPTIELPREIVMKILDTNKFTICDAYDVRFTFTPKYDVFRERVLSGDDAVLKLTTEFKFAIYGHIDSVLRSGSWHHSKVAQQLSNFIESERQERIETINKGLIT